MADIIGTDTSPAHRREVFYAGGQYVPDADGAHSLQGQMYVERLIPVEVKSNTNRPFPIVFIHGATRSGMDWLTKPDGQLGWASYFLSQGFECYLVDLPYRGRSPWYPGNGKMMVYPAEPIMSSFTACKDQGTWPQAKLHTQWPGAGVKDDPIFDQFYASGLQILDDVTEQEKVSQAACAALLDRIGKPVILLGHSAGGSVPWLAADIRPNLVEMIIAIEPTGPPFSKWGVRPGPGAAYGITNAPLIYDPPVADPEKDFVKTVIAAPAAELTDCNAQAESPPPRQLINLIDRKVLLVTAQASYHSQYDWGTFRYLKQAGVKDVTHLKLEEKGLYGNGHMMFMEKNSDEVAAELLIWIDEYQSTA
ncbi:alpha/beta-hydrolase [Hypoxylon trugodes]|uniref:alpha/beta-hydrolase n=1 Tax=Hypoxylon trugodes TaxID=326681 RepID=UPI0021970092|nr:alpha/beta-hydrolase [Hypoxylon trugodes]KAI1389952.1 alpha/beta-hydrolase [Hypoxylon trugodes]